MDAQHFEAETVKRLEELTSSLDKLESRTRAACEKRESISWLDALLKKIGDASQECASTMDYYRDEEMPKSILAAMADTQRAIKDCVGGLVLYAAIARLVVEPS